MDLETENRIAAILLKEAAELRRQSEREGVLAYLQKPNVRGRPNSRFLSATVLGVQQANRAVEVNEMWRIRQKEQELEDRLAGRSKDESSDRRWRHFGESSGGPSKEAADCNRNARTGSLNDRIIDSCPSMEDGDLRDEELQEFLLSKAKRGRGSVGPRMDEAGPYPARNPGSRRRPSVSPELRVQGRHEPQMILGPEKPSSLKCDESSEEEYDKDKKKKAKKTESGNSKKQHSRKHKSKVKSKDRKRKRKDNRSKY